MTSQDFADIEVSEKENYLMRLVIEDTGKKELSVYHYDATTRKKTELVVLFPDVILED